MQKHTIKNIYFLKNENNFIDFLQFFENAITNELHDISFKTKNVMVHKNFDFNYILKDMHNKLLEEESNFVTRNSEWSFERIDGLQLKLNKVNLIHGSTYLKS